MIDLKNNFPSWWTIVCKLRKDVSDFRNFSRKFLWQFETKPVLPLEQSLQTPCWQGNVSAIMHLAPGAPFGHFLTGTCRLGAQTQTCLKFFVTRNYCLTKISIRAKRSISRVFSLFIVPSPFFVHCPYKGRINRAETVLIVIFGFCHCF